MVFGMHVPGPRQPEGPGLIPLIFRLFVLPPRPQALHEILVSNFPVHPPSYERLHHNVYLISFFCFCWYRVATVTAPCARKLVCSWRVRGRPELCALDGESENPNLIQIQIVSYKLKDLVAKGQKTDNGFRTGYLNKLEDALRKAFPGCDLQATPHITSKITTWRKHYSAIVSAKLLATDRATGEAAREVPEAVGEMEGQAQPPNLNIPEESNDDNVLPGEGRSGVHKNTNQAHGDQEENSASQKAKNTSRRRSSGKKRKTNSEQSEPELTKLFGEFCKSTGERLETIASRIGYDHDLGAARKQIYEQLGKIEGLSIKDKLHASKIIGGKVEMLEMWITLPDDARVVFVMEVLGQD
ncbi:hypothetical protein ACS0TY_010668 [Phlomoides rotata]